MSVRAYETIREETYGPHDGRLPLEHVVPGGTSAARRWWVTAEVDQLLENARYVSVRSRAKVARIAAPPLCHLCARRPRDTSLVRDAAQGRVATGRLGAQDERRVARPLTNPPSLALTAPGARWGRGETPPIAIGSTHLVNALEGHCTLCTPRRACTRVRSAEIAGIGGSGRAQSCRGRVFAGRTKSPVIWHTRGGLVSVGSSGRAAREMTYGGRYGRREC